MNLQTTKITNTLTLCYAQNHNPHLTSTLALLSSYYGALIFTGERRHRDPRRQHHRVLSRCDV